MIPVDLTELLRKRLSDRRSPSGMMRASSELLGSLRHAQLRLAGAPTVESEIVSDIRMQTGTMWHTYIGDMLVRAGVPFMQEVKLNDGLPKGWAGVADAVFWDVEARGFVLADYKTIKGEGMKWVLKEGAKEDHIWQLSAYWWACYNLGLPMVKGFGVWYLPQNATTERDEAVEPTLMECDPIEKDVIFPLMEDKRAKVDAYLQLIADDKARYMTMQLTNAPMAGPSDWPKLLLNDLLAEETPRVQKLYWNGKQSVFDVKLVPHWSTHYCPFPTELCACSEQGSTKIGHYTTDGKYVPRKGQETEQPTVNPTEADYKKRHKETENAYSHEDKEHKEEDGSIEDDVG